MITGHLKSHCILAIKRLAEGVVLVEVGDHKLVDELQIVKENIFQLGTEVAGAWRKEGSS